MKRLHISAALLLCAGFALCGISHAQTTEDTNPTAIEIDPIETAQIGVRNIASNMVAYWLDPAHQPMPVPLQMSQKNSGDLFTMGIELRPQPGNGNGPSDLRLPSGIQSLVSMDPQNILWVRGTKTALDTLQKLVKELDVPLNQVEIEAQIWEISPATLKILPLVFRDATEGGGAKKAGDSGLNSDFFSRIAFAMPTSDIAPTTQILTANIKDQSARLIASPRVNVVDGLVATAQSNESRTFIFGDNTSAGARDKSKNKEATPPIDKAALPEGFAFVNGQTALTVRPILRGDAMSLIFSITLDNSITQAATTLHDGQTLPVRLAGTDAENGRVRVALIKAHIIRRAGDTN